MSIMFCFCMLSILVVNVGLPGCDSHLVMIPSAVVEKTVGERLVITITSNTSLNNSKSHIACQFNPLPDCPAKSNFEVLYSSSYDRVNNGTTRRFDRFSVSKRSRLDFDIIIDGIKMEDQGCYYCNEMSDEDSDERMTNVLVNNGTGLHVLITQDNNNLNHSTSELSTPYFKTERPTKEISNEWVIVIVVGCLTMLAVALFFLGWKLRKKVHRLCRSCVNAGESPSPESQPIHQVVTNPQASSVSNEGDKLNSPGDGRSQ